MASLRRFASAKEKNVNLKFCGKKEHKKDMEKANKFP